VGWRAMDHLHPEWRVWSQFLTNEQATGRGSHSSTCQLNLSRFCHLLVSPCLIDWGETMHHTYPIKCAYVEPKSERA